MTLYTLDIDKLRKEAGKTAVIYLEISCLCLIFALIYEYFSHGVYSGYMIFAWLFPFIGGAVPFAVLTKVSGRYFPGNAVKNIYHSGIAALTVGSIFQGVLDIYGTTNELMRVYWIVGIGFGTVGIVLFIIQQLRYKDKE